ncbi:carbonyl reductase [NADPH] 1-like isoform X3 [Manis javanica]|uniref:carbonyl reductase [NADPH] 1-like isoform X3 n=1 Tax=Manis javanica TaxID=9974 RepID=UPI003C6CF934
MTELPPRSHYKAGCLDWGQATVTLSPQPLRQPSTTSSPHSPAMTSYSGVALVTGANRGIGLAIVRSLCQQFSGDVVLTARDTAQGHAAVQQLQAEGLSPRFHLLDICNRQSIWALRDFLLKEYGGLDVLVNNAGIAFNDDPTRLHFQAQMTMKTNFFGTRDVCTDLLPLVRPQVSKVGLTVLSRIQARKLSEQRTGDKILLNSCCPGWVRTDMGGPEALKSPEEGAETPVYLALLPSNVEGPHGEFVLEKNVVQWEPGVELPAWLQLCGVL